jgi:hypothetical protein
MSFYEGHLYIFCCIHMLFKDASKQPSYFLSFRVSKLNKCTYKCSFENLCFFHEAFCRTHTAFSLLLHQENATENISLAITVVTFTDICVLQFSSLVSGSLQECGSVWYTFKHGLGRNPHCILDPSVLFFFVSFCLLGVTKFCSLPRAGVCCVLCQVCGTLYLLLMCSEVKAPFVPLVLGPSVMPG